MKVPETTTRTSTTPLNDQNTESKKTELPVSHQEPPKSNENEAKGAQSLAEQNKASQKLQENIQKSQLHQQFGGMPGTKTTTTSTTGAVKTPTAAKSDPPRSLDEMASLHKLDSKQMAEIKDFAKKNGVPEKDLIKVAGHDRYSGAEKTE